MLLSVVGQGVGVGGGGDWKRGEIVIIANMCALNLWIIVCIGLGYYRLADISWRRYFEKLQMDFTMTIQ